MANLLITKLSDGSFSFVVDGDTVNTIINLRNDMTTFGNECHFKTSNGANLIKIQQILFNEVTIVDGATLPVATSPLDLRLKLISVGFWDWLYTGGSGADRFDELLDTTPYFGNNGKIPIVNEAQLRLDYTNIPDTSYLDLFPKPLIALQALRVNSLANAYEFYEPVNIVTQFIRSGYTLTSPSEDVIKAALDLKANASDIITTDAVLNESSVTGVTATDAFNTLNGGLVYKRTIAQIRAFTGTLPSNNFYTTDLGQEGNWYYDSTDVTSTDNTGTILVTSDGKRIKRIFKGGASIRWFGAVPDGTTDSRIAIQNAINASKDVFVPIGTFYVSGTINLLNKTNLTGAGIGSILYSKDGDYPVLEVTAVDISVRDLAITGDGRGTLTNYSTVRPNNNGIQIIGNYPTSSYSSIILENLTLNNLGNAGLYIRNNQSNNFTPTVLATNINAGANLVGFYLDTKAEYSSFTNCASNRNEYGTLINGGNNNFTGGSITNNRTGVYIGAGANDGHSVFSAVAINHNIEYSVHAKDILYGYLFSGCMLYYGDIWLDNSDMVKFVDCDMYTPNVYANSSTKIEFKGNKWTLTPNLILNFMGQPSDVRWIDNFITDGGTNATVTNSKFIGTVSGQPATVNTEFVTKAQLDAVAVPGVKRYKALISQTGTSAPTVIVLENSLSSTPVWTRNAVGSYYGTVSGGFNNNKTIGFISGSMQDDWTFGISTTNAGANTIWLQTRSAGVSADNMLDKTSILIEEYP